MRKTTCGAISGPLRQPLVVGPFVNVIEVWDTEITASEKRTYGGEGACAGQLSCGRGHDRHRGGRSPVDPCQTTVRTGPYTAVRVGTLAAAGQGRKAARLE